MQSARVMKTRFRSGSATIRHLVESRTPPTVFQPLVRGNLLRARVGSASSRQLSAALGITKREYELTVLKSESGANKKEEVEKEVLDPATVPRRVLSALLDTVAISAVAANVAEYAIKTHATGTEPFICTFAALWILRDQADFGLSRFRSPATHRTLDSSGNMHSPQDLDRYSCFRVHAALQRWQALRLGETCPRGPLPVRARVLHEGSGELHLCAHG
eukprot:SAG11_NODE_1414_length_4978_cov_31.434720_4_plen_218_part_00